VAPGRAGIADVDERRKIIIAHEWRKAGEPADYRQIRRYWDIPTKPAGIYTVPTEGGTPKLITDKASCYFQGWSPDGNDEPQITTDDFSNWFPHVSPNGTQVAYRHPNDADIHGRSGVVPFGGVESGQPESGVGELPEHVQ
jgi:hypothetical protein